MNIAVDPHAATLTCSSKTRPIWSYTYRFAFPAQTL